MAAHILAVVAACAGLAIWWRRLARDPIVGSIINAGAIARAVLGPAIVAISYFELPIGRAYQIGGGFWFFGIDGRGYFEPAVEAAAKGLKAILYMPPELPSVFYNKALAFTVWALGPNPAVALVLNLFCYFAICYLLIRWRARVGASPRALRFAVAVMSLCPTLILWALQPMKESFFLAVTTTFLVSMLVVLDGLASPPRAGKTAAGLAIVAAAASLYGLAGIRWYFALILFLAMAVTVLMTAARHPARRLARIGAGAATIVLLGQMMPLGADVYWPPWANALLLPTPDRAAQLSSVARSAVDSMNDAREGMLTYKATTTIHVAKPTPGEPQPPPNTAGSVSAPVTPQNPGEALVPKSTWDRLRTGAAAMLVPRWIASPLGLFEATGGRNLWGLAEVDTLFLDLALFGSLLLVRHDTRAGLVRHPMFWLIGLTTVLIAGSLAFTAPNFGTLLRQRATVLLGLALWPLGMVARRGETLSEAGTPQSTPRAR